MTTESTPSTETNGSYCWNCGEALSGGVTTCQNCGVDVSGEENGTATATGNRSGSGPDSPDSGWYSSLFLGVGVMVIGYLGLGLGSLSMGGAQTADTYQLGQGLLGLAALVIFAGHGLVGLSIWKDATHVARMSEWSPFRIGWTIGGLIGGVNVVVIPLYLYRRSQQTGQSWRPRPLA